MKTACTKTNLWKNTLCLILGALWQTALFSGCGYHFKSDGEPVGIRIESIAIPLMASTSSEPGFESDFTRVIREEFIRHAQVPLLTVEEAHMLLTGRVYDVATEPITYEQQQQTVQNRQVTYRTTNNRRLKLKLEASLTDRSSGKIVWEQKTLEGWADFLVSPDPLITRFHQQKALQAIARELARKIYQQSVERF